MKLYTCEYSGIVFLAVERNEKLVDLSGVNGLPREMLGLLRGGKEVRETLEAALSNSDLPTYSMDQVKISAPIARPGKVLCTGVNYRGHLEENPSAILPEEPFFFAKFPSNVIGPNDAIIHPRQTKQLDYEVELAVVIGDRMIKTPEEEVMGYVAGYTILHDVSARDVQFKDNQITLGKNFDTFCPIGPCIVTMDEISDPSNLALKSIVNGQVMQDSSTRDWLFPLPKLLSFLSHVMTLEIGDIVSTGTPRGVGVFRDPQVFLKPGDSVILEIEGIGKLENFVVGLD